MKVKLLLALVIVASAALSAEAHLFRHFAGGGGYCTSDGDWAQEGSAAASPMQGGWQGGYYDVAWGMPLAVLVPPTARWQTDYSWGAGGTRISPINPGFQRQYPGPESTYRMGAYLPAPVQPSDTRQMGDYNVRGPRR